MKRLFGILIKIGVLLLIVVALLVSFLRLALPHIDKYHSTVIAHLQRISGLPINIAKIEGEWLSFGPALTLQEISVRDENISFQVERVVLELDIWHSLINRRLQFRDFTLYRMELDLGSELANNSDRSIQPGSIQDIFLRQINYFDLRDSHISFFSPSGTPVELEIPQLTWLNSKQRHQAEGLVSLSSFNGQHGALKVILDLYDDKNNLLSNGTVYLQADDVDMRPWFSRWLRANTGLDSARFSLAAWVNIKDGEPQGGDLLLKQGNMNWGSDESAHELTVAEQLFHAERYQNGWMVETPSINIATDNKRWPNGQLSALWLPENNAEAGGPPASEQLRIRATDLQFELVKPLLPIFSFLDPEKLAPWLELDPKGRLQALALDIPIKQPDSSQFIVAWQDVSWPVWQKLPGVDNFSGRAQGDFNAGSIQVELEQSVLPFGKVFRAPLEIGRAQGTLYWQNNEQGLRLWSEALDVQAKSLWVNGEFSFTRTPAGQSWLSILAGIRLDDAKEAWRYYPETLMGQHLVDYLTGAIQGGQANNATLIYSGLLSDFPYKKNTGIFEVFVPLRQATFQFQPGWLPFSDLTIDLDFVNDGLWMKAVNGMLGKVSSSNVTANIPVFIQQKLFIDADVKGTGSDIYDYLSHSPLKDSVGAALQQVQVNGNVSGRLHLDIPLNLNEGGSVLAKGQVNLHNSNVNITALNSQLSQVSGRFNFNGGELTSQKLSANWLGQPVSLRFNTKLNQQNYQVNVDLAGRWQLNKLPGLPPKVAADLSAFGDWRSDIKITLPHQGMARYQVGIEGAISQVSERLASLLKVGNQPLPLNIQASGDLSGFNVHGAINRDQQFNSRWQLLNDKLHLERGIWTSGSLTEPELPKDESLVLSLPAIDGEYWLAAFTGNKAASSARSSAGLTAVTALNLPKHIQLNMPSLTLVGQQWNNLSVDLERAGQNFVMGFKGQELDGTLRIEPNQPWQADINYIYYNPEWPSSGLVTTQSESRASAIPTDFAGWPSLALTCEQCWLFGQNFNQIQANLTAYNNRLVLSDGLMNSGSAKLTVSGEWLTGSFGSESSFRGKLSSERFDQSMRHFGIITPLRDAPMSSEFDLSWLGTPWDPRIYTLSGRISAQFGKGDIANLNGGRAGQILSLVSISALLRKLQFDLRDPFGKGFYFDSIKLDTDINRGVMHTNNLLIDGVVADIAMRGSIDLVERQIDMEAVVAPELSVTVGVATAFVVNPVVGVAVFAASQVLSPLWQRVSFIRYRISGSLDRPNVDEILRQANEEKPSEKP